MEHALPDSLDLQLRITDPEALADLGALPDGPSRNELAQSALRIGLIAIRRAKGEIDSVAVRHEADRLLGMLAKNLENHQSALAQRLTDTLREYFDPADGKFNERVERFVREDGELEQLLRRKLSAEGSELAHTLSSFVGDQSPLMRHLDPEQAAGFFGTLQTTLGETLEKQQRGILEQFSLDNKEGALSRLLEELRSKNSDVGEDLQKRVEKLAGEFSTDREDSAISRLVQRVDLAQRKITGQFSLDDEQSALARMQRGLLDVFEKQRRESDEFQNEVREVLTRLDARKVESQRSTRHGNDFEEETFRFLQQESQACGDVATSTGSSKGEIGACKVGDAVVELGPESAAPDGRIVVEVKASGSYNLKKALEELDLARKNRGASVGLFVFSQRHAPEELRPLQRFGHNVVVVWDAEDPATDVFLRGGLMVARALCVRMWVDADAQAADLPALERSILAVEQQAESLSQISTWATTIRNNADKILSGVSDVREELDTQTRELHERLKEVRTLLSSSANSL